MKKIFSIVCLFSCLSFSMFAQENTTKILDKTAAIFEKSSGLQANYDVSIKKGAQHQGESRGDIYIKKNKFHIANADLLTWFDGTTQWLMLKNSGEVNITYPTKEEIQSINPYTFIYLYKKGYKASHTTSTYNKRKCYDVKLVAQNKKAKMQQINVYIDQQSYLPLYISLTDDRKVTTIVRLGQVKNNVNLKDSFFTFNPKDYPNIDIIDLR